MLFVCMKKRIKTKQKKRKIRRSSLSNEQEIEQTKTPTHWSQLEIPSHCSEWKSHRHHTETNSSHSQLIHHTSQRLFVQNPIFTSILVWNFGSLIFTLNCVIIIARFFLFFLFNIANYSIVYQSTFQNTIQISMESFMFPTVAVASEKVSREIVWSMKPMHLFFFH